MVKALFIISIFVSSGVLAEEITGAFGVTLGDKFEKSKYTVKEYYKTLRGHRYTVDAPSGSRCFKEFKVFTTITTNTAYWIKAKCLLESSALARKELSVINLLLLEKYNNLNKEKVSSGRFRISDHDNDMYVSTNLMGSTIVISYGSNKYDKLASAELYTIRYRSIKDEITNANVDNF